jgi:hypothetical protein
MTRTHRFSASTALLAAAMAMPVAGWAQTQEGPNSPPAAKADAAQAGVATAAPQRPASPLGHPPAQATSLEKGVEAHIRQLHQELHITAAEQPQWEQFADVMRGNARAMQDSLDQRAQQIGSMTAADSMTSYAQLAVQRSQDLVKLATSFQTLYGTFSDQQKKDADALFRRQATAHADKHTS